MLVRLAIQPLGVFEVPLAFIGKPTIGQLVFLRSTQVLSSLIFMIARELNRRLAAKGCKFENHRGGSGHLTVRRGDQKSQLPTHGGRKELGTGLVNKILKDLGLK